MKKVKKILIISFLWLFIITVFGVIGVEAQREIEFRPQVEIPGFGTRKFGDEGGSTQYIAEYVVAIYRYGISIGAILATVVLMAAGLMWLTSGGNQEKIGQAKNMISGSIIGLVLLFGSYTILNTINPELVNFYIKDIDLIPEITYGCCGYRRENGSTGAKMTSLAECEQLDNNYYYGENYITKANELLATNQRCTEKRGCCTVSVFYDLFSYNLNADSKTVNMKFPVDGPSSCKQIDKKIFFKNYRVISKYTNGACQYEKTLNCSGAGNGALCFNGSRSAGTGQGIDCNTEGVCGWCYNGACINTFANENQPCGGYEVGKCQNNCLDNQVEFVSGRPCTEGLKCCYPIN